MTMRLFGADTELPHGVAGFFAEFFGSMIFVFGAAGSIALQYAVPSLAPDAVLSGFAYGLSYAIAIWIAGPISGGHINPLVSITFYVHGLVERAVYKGNRTSGDIVPHGVGRMERFWWYFALAWVIAQFLGAITAGALLLAVFGSSNPLGRPAIGGAFGFSDTQAFGYEIIGSSILFLVALIVVMHPRMRPWAPLARGLTLAFLAMVGVTISGSAFNWWLHFGPTVIANSWDDQPAFNCPLGAVCPVPTPFVTNDGFDPRNADWIWYVGPLIGVAISLGVFWVLFYYWWGQNAEYIDALAEERESIEAKHIRNNASKKSKKPRKPRHIRTNTRADVESIATDMFVEEEDV